MNAIAKKGLPKLAPDIRLFGKVDQAMLSEFFRQQAALAEGTQIVLELSTPGGDADIGRRIAEEIRLMRAAGREMFFLGKTFVFSAGVTIMSAFPRTHRYLTADCELLIHERKMSKDLRLEGALRGCKAVVNDALAEIESGQRLERAGFEKLAEGSVLTVEDVMAKVMEKDWYLTAEEARRIGLAAAVV